MSFLARVTTRLWRRIYGIGEGYVKARIQEEEENRRLRMARIREIEAYEAELQRILAEDEEVDIEKARAIASIVRERIIRGEH